MNVPAVASTSYPGSHESQEGGRAPDAPCARWRQAQAQLGAKKKEEQNLASQSQKNYSQQKNIAVDINNIYPGYRFECFARKPCNPDDVGAVQNRTAKNENTLQFKSLIQEVFFPHARGWGSGTSLGRHRVTRGQDPVPVNDTKGGSGLVTVHQ